jgi:hypothetical protein
VRMVRLCAGCMRTVTGEAGLYVHERFTARASGAP